MDLNNKIIQLKAYYSLTQKYIGLSSYWLYHVKLFNNQKKIYWILMYYF